MAQHDYVTPFTGVWIETASTARASERQEVTPFTGVWIETTGCLSGQKMI